MGIISDSEYSRYVCSDSLAEIIINNWIDSCTQWLEWSDLGAGIQRQRPRDTHHHLRWRTSSFRVWFQGVFPSEHWNPLIRLDRYLFPSTEEIVAVTWRLFLPTFYIYESISVTILFTWKEKVRGSIALHCAHLPQSRSWRWRGCIWRTSFRSLIPFWQISLFNSGGWGVQTGYNPGDRCTDL